MDEKLKEICRQGYIIRRGNVKYGKIKERKWTRKQRRTTDGARIEVRKL
jgi:hypothetical protein